MGANIIDSTFESTTVGQRINVGADINFMQYGIRDNAAAIMESLIGGSYSALSSYIMKGCVKSSAAGTTTITAGYIFGIPKALGGMVSTTYIYSATTQSFPDPAGADVVIGTITPFSSAPFDPTPFTDSIPRNVHNEYRVVWSTGASGSGDVDFSDLLMLRPNWTNVSTFGAGWVAVVNPPRFKLEPITNMLTISGVAISSSVTPNMTIFTLPVGYRPSLAKVVRATRYESATYTVIPLYIDPTGVVTFANAADVVSTVLGGVYLTDISIFLD